MSFRPKYLAHVNVYVRDVERSHKWYADLLGLHTYDYRPGAAAFMSADRNESHEIALMQVGPNAPLQTAGQVGLNHMAWRVESLDDLKEFYRRLNEKGVPIARIVDHGISLGIYFRDPDGNGIEVYYEMPRSEWPRQERIFAPDMVRRGLFPGPWDAVADARPA
ncbi:MAG TPA: VOC family protein [Stellaceae bacterium]|nr:VOC family protein [Stellaceae bacterium]